MTRYAIAKGTYDILPHSQGEEFKWRLSHLWDYVESVIREVAHNYGYREVRTPLFEKIDLFSRSVGETSDIVSKEMYTFQDRAGREMALRPEGTAAVMRAFVEKHLDQAPGLSKYFYIAPMFRYERPQSGRYRQHHQFGIEAIGENTPEQDVEVIDLLLELYRRLGLTDLTVQLNSIGDETTRSSYKKALADYLTPHFDKLSTESQARFEKNILRILDSKDAEDKALLKQAPKITEMLTEEASARFDRVQSLLKKLGVNYTLDPHLVRGLDYYNHTVFEVTAGQLGAQNAIGAGGRFDGLIQTLGGPDLPAMGFATGIERILQTMIGQGVNLPDPPGPLIYFIPMGDEARKKCFSLLYDLRHKGVSASMESSGKKVKGALKIASEIGAKFVAIIGDDELSKGGCALKEMEKREEIPLSFDEIYPYLQGTLS